MSKNALLTCCMCGADMEIGRRMKVTASYETGYRVNRRIEWKSKAVVLCQTCGLTVAEVVGIPDMTLADIAKNSYVDDYEM